MTRFAGPFVRARARSLFRPPDTALAPAGGGVRDALSCRPGLVELLGGPAVARIDGENDEAFENRLGTRLMALYRDRRSPESFEALYELTRPAVQRWVQALLRNNPVRLDPVELVQDTFVNVYLYASGFRSDHAGSFRVWVRTIAGNLIRRAASRNAEAFASLPEGGFEPTDSGFRPEEQAAYDEQRRLASSTWLLFLMVYARVWSELRERDRAALELVEVHGLSYVDAGLRIGVGRSNMKMIVFRARRRIAAGIRSWLGTALRPAGAQAVTSIRRAG